MFIPMSVDPHGRLGPFMMHFLFSMTPQPMTMTFQSQRSNAKEMYRRLTTSPCPSGVIIQAAIQWKKESATQFYGGSHTAPTPQEYTMQQLGLMLTRAYGMHLQKATQHMGTKLAKKTVVVVVEPPPGFESIGATNSTGGSRLSPHFCSRQTLYRTSHQNSFCLSWVFFLRDLCSERMADQNVQIAASQ